MKKKTKAIAFLFITLMFITSFLLFQETKASPTFIVNWGAIDEGLNNFEYEITINNPLPDTRANLSILIDEASFDPSRTNKFAIYFYKNITIRKIKSYWISKVKCSPYQRGNNTISNCTDFGYWVNRTVFEKDWEVIEGELIRNRREFIYNLGQVDVLRGENSFKINFKFPIVEANGRWGSSGRLALLVEGSRHHPWWNTSCSHRLKLSVTENNNTDLYNYPVSTAPLNTVNLTKWAFNETRVLLDNTHSTDFMFNETSPETNLTLFWETNVSASSTIDDYLYYNCEGLTNAQKTVNSYSNYTNMKFYAKLDGNHSDEIQGTFGSDPSGGDWSVGRYGNASGSFSFDGSSQSRYTNANYEFHDWDNFTIEFLVKNAGYTSADARITGRGVEGGPQLFAGIWSGHGMPYFFLEPENVGAVECYGTSNLTKITKNNWTHLAFVRDSGDIIIYVNGVNESTCTDTTYGSAGNFTSTDICIGGGYGTNCAGGRNAKAIVDEVVWSNWAKQPEEFVPRPSPPTITQGEEENMVVDPTIISNSTVPTTVSYGDSFYITTRVNDTEYNNITNAVFFIQAPNGSNVLDGVNGTCTLVESNCWYKDCNSTPNISITYGGQDMGDWNWSYEAFNNNTGSTVTNSTFNIADTEVPKVIINDIPTTSTTPTVDLTITDNVELSKCWYNLTATATPSTCVGSSCYIEFTCTSNPSIPDTGSLSDGTQYKIYVFANDSTNNVNNSETHTWTVDLGDGGVSGGGGGGVYTFIVGNLSVDIEFSLLYVTFTVPYTPSSKDKTIKMESLSNVALEGVEIETSNSLLPYLNVSVCDVDLSNCVEDKFNIKGGETKLLYLQGNFDERLGNGVEGKVSLSTTDSAFELPIKVDRGPLYSITKAISDGIGVSEFISLLLVVGIGGLLIILVILYATGWRIL